MLMEGELEETGSIEDDFVVLLQYFHEEFEFCEKQEGCFLILLYCEMKR